MTGNDNVISFDNTRRDGVSRTVLARKLLGRCKELTQQHMRRILQAMFDTADDALFKMAERAADDTDKNLYLDSMRFVRLQRDHIQKRFFDALGENFNAYLDEKQRDSKPATTAIDYSALSLVSEDDLEITLATQQLIHKITSLYSADLSASNKRLAFLFGKEEVDAAKIPFGADAIVRAYAEAAENSNIMLEVRIILLKLFDLSCVHGLAALYAQINQEFIEADILPVIKPTIRKTDSYGNAMPAAPVMAPPVHPGNSSGGYGVPGVAGAPVAPAGDNLWATLQGYLQQQRSGGDGVTPGYSGGMSPGYAGGGYGAGTGVAVPGLGGGIATGGVGAGGVPVVAFTTQELLGSLTTLQQDIDGAMPAGGAHAVGNYVRVQLHGNSEDDAKTSRQLNPIDNDLIDVVCLIFDYILSDPQLPETAKASIRRLQIPLLKVALLDKDFFAMHGHPARDLLNLLAQASLGIDDSTATNNPVLVKIDEIVQRIIDEFTDDIILFSELKEEFNQFLKAQHAREAEMLTDIERTHKEREEMALAKAWVRETLEQHLLGRTLPGVVADIILGPWKDVMLQTYLLEGENSVLWKTQIRFIDVLSWSVEPKQAMLDKNKLGNIIRQLITTLRQGLQQIDYPEAEVEAIFLALEPYHLASVRGQPYQQPAGKTSALDDAIAVTNEAYTDMQQNPDKYTEEDYLGDDKVILEDIVLEGWEADPMLDAINDEYLDLARHLEMGKWVEFNDEHGNARHAKLAWKSELLGEYTFLNWKFDVVADKTLLELANDLRQGKARVMDDVPLMDRALSSVLTTLMPKAK